jgi:nucleotide-binding universal stress UspA family protein
MDSVQTGSEIDGFRLGEVMHVGSMASIYRLTGPQGELPLVIKIPRLGGGERAVNVIAFEVCRMVLGALAQGSSHPTLVAFGDVETTPYLVMEYIAGARLHEWVQRAPIAADEIARLGSALALALHEIHLQDVVHLDLKPTNVLYRQDGHATLVDFGLAHHSHYPDLLAEELRFPVGNWVYMAPEQVLGVRCDPRSDIYALGGLLYELATGRTAHGHPRSTRELRRRLHREPIPPRALLTSTPPWLQEVILRCLEIDARDRYASAADVAFDLANPAQVEVSERGTRERATGWSTRARRWLRARRFEPAPCPPPSVTIGPASIVMVALAADDADAPLAESMRDATHRLIAADAKCRIACVTAVPPSTALSGERYEETATGRHIKHLVELRRWARPLQLPEERVTYHVLESDRLAGALIDYAKLNEVDQILIGAPREGSARLFRGVSEQVVADAPCTVTVVRPRADA